MLAYVDVLAVFPTPESGGNGSMHVILLRNHVELRLEQVSASSFVPVAAFAFGFRRPEATVVGDEENYDDDWKDENHHPPGEIVISLGSIR